MDIFARHLSYTLLRLLWQENCSYSEISCNCRQYLLTWYDKYNTYFISIYIKRALIFHLKKNISVKNSYESSRAHSINNTCHWNSAIYRVVCTQDKLCVPTTRLWLTTSEHNKKAYIYKRVCLKYAMAVDKLFLQWIIYFWDRLYTVNRWMSWKPLKMVS